METHQEAKRFQPRTLLFSAERAVSRAEKHSLAFARGSCYHEKKPLPLPSTAPGAPETGEPEPAIYRKAVFPYGRKTLVQPPPHEPENAPGPHCGGTYRSFDDRLHRPVSAVFLGSPEILFPFCKKGRRLPGSCRKAVPLKFHRSLRPIHNFPLLHKEQRGHIARPPCGTGRKGVDFLCQGMQPEAACANC